MSLFTNWETLVGDVASYNTAVRVILKAETQQFTGTELSDSL